MNAVDMAQAACPMASTLDFYQCLGDPCPSLHLEALQGGRLCGTADGLACVLTQHYSASQKATTSLLAHVVVVRSPVLFVLCSTTADLPVPLHAAC